MSLADFIVRIDHPDDGPPADVRVIVYKSVAALRGAATRHESVTMSKRRRARGEHRNLFPDTLGICHRFQWVRRDGTTDPQCALVRLAVPHIGVGIISHEMAHAAFAVLDREGVAIVTMDDDERFCWVLGDLVRQTINGMNDRGVYD